MEETSTLLHKIESNIARVIIGREDTIRLLLTALLARGHVLLEDTPGTGKTMLAKALAASIDGSFKRIQFTPDLLPFDVTGTSIFDQQKQEFRFMPGPVFANILLADEINRATPKTQSALLEAMAERQVTTDGITRPLADPFFMIATENPIETIGTYPLPEAQIDRFDLKLSMGFPTGEEELTILLRYKEDTPLAQLEPVCSPAQLQQMQQKVCHIHIEEELVQYIVQIVQATRAHEQIRLGVTPRGSLSLMRLSQAHALLSGRSYVVPEDIRALVLPCFAHRIITMHGMKDSQLAGTLLQQILSGIPVPMEPFHSVK